MEGKRVLITGGNSGIGIVTARELARQGAEVVLACRDTDKTAAALKVINAGASISEGGGEDNVYRVGVGVEF